MGSAEINELLQAIGRTVGGKLDQKLGTVRSKFNRLDDKISTASETTNQKIDDLRACIDNNVVPAGLVTNAEESEIRILAKKVQQPQ